MATIFLSTYLDPIVIQEPKFGHQQKKTIKKKTWKFDRYKMATRFQSSFQ
jgi:hypothetical protein